MPSATSSVALSWARTRTTSDASSSTWSPRALRTATPRSRGMTTVSFSPYTTNAPRAGSSAGGSDARSGCSARMTGTRAAGADRSDSASAGARAGNGAQAAACHDQSHHESQNARASDLTSPETHRPGANVPCARRCETGEGSMHARPDHAREAPQRRAT